MAFVPDADHERDFRDALGRFATGVTVVTTLGEAGPLGLTANSFAAVSLSPPLVLWSPARRSSRFAAFAAAERFAIHVLGGHQVEICRHFSGSGSFAGVTHETGPDGVPLLPGCLARFDCRRVAVHEGGDHAIIVGHVLEVETAPGKPLIFQGGVFVASH